jgi:2-C-methyl-D-erythritol 2,4-cyclodiphosphate synthase
MKPYIPKMRQNLAKILGIEESQISIKAKTMEEQDSVGKKEAVAVHSVVLLKRS